MFGGFCGSLLAQRIIRHKTSKFSYQYIFCTIVAFHVVTSAILWPYVAWQNWTRLNEFVRNLDAGEIVFAFVVVAILTSRVLFGIKRG